jgi:hypothetical protein
MNHTRNFMSRNAGVGNSGPGAIYDERIAVAHSTCLHFDADLSRTGFRDLSLDNLKTSSSPRYLDCLHGCYCD